ncbi:hypothetical protein M440DRAFT_1463424 [Trichoderma longibrachiatum ATCC 18648]|uniref:Uncharacterized protein n=1 Tax=Trichoderma longibrachiatum ATCC 18648 TaxID=983965 RepID=A0A2T4C2M5_TRILO|nr:hypothetical protein M440DRAFT_1463424 [Trichoderma longibrachiatum ATCC 18648]
MRQPAHDMKGPSIWAVPSCLALFDHGSCKDSQLEAANKMAEGTGATPKLQAYSYQYWYGIGTSRLMCKYSHSVDMSQYRVKPRQGAKRSLQLQQQKHTVCTKYNVPVARKVMVGLSFPVEVDRAPLEAVVWIGTGRAARALVPHCVVHQGAKHGSLTHEH